MRLFQFSVVASSLSLALVLSACSSRSGSDAYSKEFPSVAQSARTVTPVYQASPFANPSIVYQQAQYQQVQYQPVQYQQRQTIEIRSDLANVPCETLAYEDKRMTDLGQAEQPTYEDMMAQLRLLEIRAALYSRCNQPSLGNAQSPQFTIPIEDAMNAEQIQETRRLHRSTLPENQIVSVAPAITVQGVQSDTFVRNFRTAPSVIETAKAGFEPQVNDRILPQSGTSSVIEVQKIIKQDSQASDQIQGQYKTIEKFGDTVRVKYVSFDDLPLIAGPELTAK